MAQIYLLSVLSLLFGGALLSAEVLAGRFARLEPLAELSQQPKTVITTGIVTFLIAILKIFVPFTGAVVVGDLLPILVGMTAGGLLVVSQLQDPGRIGARDAAQSLLAYRTVIGVGAMVVGVLHFFFYAAPIL